MQFLAKTPGQKIGKGWQGVLLILVGSLPIGHALQYYFAGEAYRNSPTRNWLVVGQVVLGAFIIGLGILLQIRASRRAPEQEHDTYKITED
ncbi:MAG: hypothetical protein QM785_15205 [Pyrinomonadaceae bacterium]